jgi:hypothetical protein
MYLSITNKMQRYTMVFITINALHVSGGSSAHHQDLKTVYTALGICRAFTASSRLHKQAGRSSKSCITVGCTSPVAKC